MEGNKKKNETDTSTEEKIKNAARIVFHRKGFAATRTRDIAEEAEINLALLNYYFRSKEKLFDIIMLETMQRFLKSITDVFNNESTSLDEKIQMLVNNYIDLLIVNPEIPLFLLIELRNNPDKLIANIRFKEIVMNSYFLKQFTLATQNKEIVAINPLHFIMNLIGMTVFPFVANPIFKALGEVSDDEYNKLMQERKVFIPQWIKAILKI
jgi:AcrR family transcriptional regulator